MTPGRLAPPPTAVAAAAAALLPAALLTVVDRPLAPFLPIPVPKARIPRLPDENQRASATRIAQRRLAMRAGSQRRSPATAAEDGRRRFASRRRLASPPSAWSLSSSASDDAGVVGGRSDGGAPEVARRRSGTGGRSSVRPTGDGGTERELLPLATGTLAAGVELAENATRRLSIANDDDDDDGPAGGLSERVMSRSRWMIAFILRRTLAGQPRQRARWCEMRPR